MNTHLDRQKERWEKDTLRPSMEKHPERCEVFETSSGIPVKRVYLPDSATDNFQQQLGFPGEYPFTRGVQSTMYRGRLWTMRQYAGYASAGETNARFKFLLDHGQTGLSVAFDLPTQIGFDPDDSLALGEVGRVGVSIPTLEDMTRLLDGIPLDQVSTSMTINAPAAIVLAMYVAVGKRQGIEPWRLRGTIQNDILKEYLARGTYIFPPRPSMRLTTDILQYCTKHVPYWNTISISGYHIRESGSTAVQEVAFTLANGIAYVEAAIKAGLCVDDFAPRFTFFFNAHNHFLEEVAKYRAARRLWSRIMKERFDAKLAESQMLRFHVQTGGSTLTAQQPLNNVTRVALQALAAVMGGTQSLHTNAMDEALALPRAETTQAALRTQQIIAHESGVCDTVDPLAGSYAVEALTDEIEARAQRYITYIHELGGALAAIESGYMQSEIQSAAYAYQRAIEQNEQTVVGVNTFVSAEKNEIERLTVDAAFEEVQRERLHELRERRDNEIVSTLREQLSAAARGTENLMPLLIECVERDVTLGEICHTLREVWGEYHPMGS